VCVFEARVLLRNKHLSSALQLFCVCMYVGEYARVINFVYVFEARVLLRNRHDLLECSAAVLCLCVCMYVCTCN